MSVLATARSKAGPERQCPCFGPTEKRQNVENGRRKRKKEKKKRRRRTEVGDKEDLCLGRPHGVGAGVAWGWGGGGWGRCVEGRGLEEGTGMVWVLL